MEKQGKNIIYNFKKMIQLAWNQNHSFIVYQLISNTIRGPFPLIVAYMQKIIIDRVTGAVISDNNSFSVILALVLISLSVKILYEFLMTLDTKLSIVSTNNIFVKIQELMVEKLSKLDKRHFDMPSSKDIIYRGCNFNSEAINEIMLNISTLLRQSFTAIISFIVLYKYNPVLSLVSILMYLPQFIIDNLTVNDNKKLQVEVTEASRKRDYYGSVLANKEYCKELKVYELNDFFIERYKKASIDIYRLSKKVLYRTYLRSILFGTLQTLIKGCVYGYLVYKVFTNAFTIGDITFVYSAFNDLGTDLSSSISMISSLYKNITAYDYFNRFIELENRIMDNNNSVSLSHNTHKIEFRNVSFCYPESKKYILENINFVAEPGEMVAFVGLNGSGKTTIVKLLLRLYDCSEGEILIDGINIKNISAKEYYKLWGVLFQDYNIYPLSIKENIAFGKFDLSYWDASVTKAAQLSGISETVKKLPQQYSTVLTKLFDHNGFEPSGGQIQKFALSKTFLQEYDMYIFDEPSAALDAKAENELFKSIRSAAQNKTTFLISHRLSNIIYSNKIIFIKNGRIISTGTHEILLQNKEYANMYHLQSSKY